MFTFCRYQCPAHHGVYVHTANCPVIPERPVCDGCAAEITASQPAQLNAADAEAGAPWIWEYAHLDGSDLITVMAKKDDLAELKRLIAKSFFDYTWEEVERRGIFGTSVLVKRNGRYVDTGHWVYRKAEVKA